MYCTRYIICDVSYMTYQLRSARICFIITDVSRVHLRICSCWYFIGFPPVFIKLFILRAHSWMCICQVCIETHWSPLHNHAAPILRAHLRMYSCWSVIEVPYICLQKLTFWELICGCAIVQCPLKTCTSHDNLSSERSSVDVQLMTVHWNSLQFNTILHFGISSVDVQLPTFHWTSIIILVIYIRFVSSSVDVQLLLLFHWNFLHVHDAFHFESPSVHVMFHSCH